MIKNFGDFKIDFEKQIIDEEISLDTIRENKHYLHRLSMFKTLEWLNNYIAKTDSNQYNQQNNIYSIVGDRGTGKSSFILTLESVLKKGKYFYSEESTKKLVYPLPKIDPTIFDSRINILEFFVAYLKRGVDDNNKNYEGYNDRFLDLERFNEKSNEIIEILQTLRIQDSRSAEGNTSVEFLDSLLKRSDFRKKIEELVRLFLNIVSGTDKEYGYISLIIDDLDLIQNSNVYEFLEYIFKFFQYQKQIIVFLAYREEQLNTAVIDSLIQENKNLLKNKIINTQELQKQATNYIEKGLPRNQRVYLLINEKTKIYDVVFPFLEVDQRIEFENYLVAGGKVVTINDFFQKEMMKKTRLQISPIDASENTKFTFPKTLRSVIELLGLIQTMKEFNFTQVSTQGIWNLRDNIKAYKYYMISRLKDYLPVEELQVIDEWSNRDYATKNSYICKELFKQIEDKEEDNSNIFEQLEKITEKEPYNTSLGDVFTAITAFKNRYRNNEEKYFFIYGIKMLYSIELLLTLTKYFLSVINKEEVGYDEEQNSKLGNYLSLAQGKIMPDEFWYSNNWISGKADTAVAKNSVVPDELIRKNLLYSSVSTYNLEKERYKNYTGSEFSFRYRVIYNKSKSAFANTANRRTKKYSFDFFSKVIDREYLTNATNKILSEKASNNFYFFYSMFDLDFFSRKNYTRHSLSGKFEEAEIILKRINNLFTGELGTIDEKQMKKKMVVPLFFEKEEDTFSPLFDEEEIKSIVTHLKAINGNMEKDIFGNEVSPFVLKILKEYNDDNKFFPIANEYRRFLKDLEKVNILDTIDLNEFEHRRIFETIKKGSKTKTINIDKRIFAKICENLLQEL